jgi:hypothetical protein
VRLHERLTSRPDRERPDTAAFFDEDDENEETSTLLGGLAEALGRRIARPELDVLDRLATALNETRAGDGDDENVTVADASAGSAARLYPENLSNFVSISTLHFTLKLAK